MKKLNLLFALTRRLVGIIVILCATPLNSAIAEDWTTYGYDAAHTGDSPLEQTITADNVSTLSPLWSFSTSSASSPPGILTQPLVAKQVSNVNGKTRDLVFVGDLDGNFFAIDDSDGSQQWKWSTQPGYVTRYCSASPNDVDLPNGHYGMIGTPVIDRNADQGAGRVYIALLGKVYALKLSDGTPAPGWTASGVTIVNNPFSPSISSGGFGDGYPAGTTETGIVVYGGLTLNAGKLYIPFGGISCDVPENYHGRVAVIDTSTAQLGNQWFSVSPTSPTLETGGSIWGASGAAVDPLGGVFVATGNTIGGAAENDQYGEHVVKLSLDLASVLGSDDPSAATPPLIQGVDKDFGSNPILFQPQNCANPLAAVLNKNGELIIYARDHLGNATSYPPQVVQVGYKAAPTEYAGSLIGAPAWDASRQQLYVSNNSNGGYAGGVIAFSFTNCVLNSTSPTWVTTPPNWSVGTGLEGAITPPTTANDLVYFGTGISGGPNPRAFAIDARPACTSGVTTGCSPNPGKILWQSAPFTFNIGVFTAPTVVNGRVYVVSMDGKLSAFGLPITGAGGSLSGSGNSTTTVPPANLTNEGPADWIKWGVTNVAGVNRKAGVTALLTTYTQIGTGTVARYTNDPRPLSWTDGTPTATGTNNLTGVYIPGVGSGFSFTAPADTTTRTLTVHVGGWNSGGTLTAHLSDGSAADFVDVTSTATGQYDRNYVLTYKAASAGQTLTVSWKMSSGTGNVTLNGAALTSSGGTVTAPTVTTLAASSVSATGATLNGSANPNGADTTAWFRYSTVNPNTCNDTFGTRFPATGGLSLGSGTSAVAFSQSPTGLSASTTYYFCAIGSNSASTAFGSVLFFTTSTTSGGGSLSGSGNSSATAANLTIEGTADWIKWGVTNVAGVNRKAGVPALLTTYTQIGTGTVARYTNDPRPLSWTGGTPTATGTNNLTGLYIAGVGSGFSFTAPADTTIRTLTVHVGGWNSGGRLVAHLSDSSAADFVDVTPTATGSYAGQYDRNYVLTYSAASAGQTLTVRWTMSAGAGNVTLNGAALK